MPAPALGLHPTVVSAPAVLTSEGLWCPGTVTVADGRIQAVRRGRPRAGPGHRALPTGTLVPGLVDAQVNGGFGVDLGRDGARAWARLAARLPATGVTAYLPTLVSAPLPALVERLRLGARLVPGADPLAARMLGIHLEGPFLAATHAGAHDPAALLDPTPARVASLLDAAAGCLAMVTLAPERPGALAAVRALSAAGVVVSLGHSGATGDQVRAAADAGARAITHLFNAQRGLGHRELGVAGVGLTDARFTCGLIADTHHVAAEVLRLVLAVAPGRVALATDATAATGMPPGRYRLGGRVITLPADGPPRLADGTIAGSALQLWEAVRTLVGLGIDLQTAVEAASRIAGRQVRHRPTPSA
ncbi:MAG TPA: N-acetylglucosamine-6-phosphate deacetylase [Candidatus Dormibacteraeota bacterium]|nr:N-acetylglucosamine-6-phosphate deacetylase [Candidatus Dormibacteraeota bacterium]